MRETLDAVIVGGGPAGLATSYHLQKRGVRHVVLERGSAGESWTSRVYDSLTLHTGKHMSSLPGMPFTRSAPLFVARPLFVDYLRQYRERFALPVREHCDVTSVRRDGDRWIVESNGEVVTARALVIATGIMPNPHIPALPGQSAFHGTVRHSSTYRRPDDYRGRRVLVVGCGNSGGEIASELGAAGVDTTISIRSGANVVPLRLLGIPIQYLAWTLLQLPRPLRGPIQNTLRTIVEWIKGPPPFPPSAVSPLDAIPMIGYKLVDAIRSGRVKLRGAIESLTARGALFAGGAEEPFDDVILATGFRAAIGFLGIRTDARGFALRRDRVTSSEHEGLYFVGHNYDSTGALFNIRKDSRLVAEAIAK